MFDVIHILLCVHRTSIKNFAYPSTFWYPSIYSGKNSIAILMLWTSFQINIFSLLNYKNQFFTANYPVNSIFIELLEFQDIGLGLYKKIYSYVMLIRVPTLLSSLFNINIFFFLHSNKITIIETTVFLKHSSFKLIKTIIQMNINVTQITQKVNSTTPLHPKELLLNTRCWQTVCILYCDIYFSPLLNGPFLLDTNSI